MSLFANTMCFVARFSGLPHIDTERNPDLAVFVQRIFPQHG